MTTTRTELERREDRKMKNAIYNHPSTRRHVAETNAGRTRGDEVRKRHGGEKGALDQALRKESVQLAHRHKMESDKHYETSLARPVEMEKRHEKERDAQKRDHDARRAEMARRHRQELDKVED
jgi:hypothetical protein